MVEMRTWSRDSGEGVEKFWLDKGLKLNTRFLKIDFENDFEMYSVEIEIDFEIDFECSIENWFWFLKLIRGLSWKLIRGLLIRGLKLKLKWFVDKLTPRSWKIVPFENVRLKCRVLKSSKLIFEKLKLSLKLSLKLNLIFEKWFFQKGFENFWLGMLVSIRDGR